MILNREQNNVVIDTEEESVKMNISASSSVQDHIIKLLTESGYKKPIESLVRESTCNAIDSHVEAGIPEEQVLVKLYRENANWIYEVEDVGIGLNEEEFYKYCMNIGESTKRNRTDLIGAMGKTVPL